MKNAFSLKNSWCILFLFLSVFLFGQKGSLSFQVKQGMTGFEIKKFDNSSYDKIIGGDFSIGLDYSYSFFKKKYFAGSFGILWNTSSFAERRIHETNFGFVFNVPTSISPRREETTYRFHINSILFPLKIKTQVRKIGISLGLISRYHLSTKMLFEEITEVISAPLDYEVVAITYKAGETILDSPLNYGRGEQLFLKDKMDIQFLFGLGFFLNERISFELEYRDLLYNNNFLKMRRETFFGEWNIPSRKYDFSLATISIGVNYRIF